MNEYVPEGCRLIRFVGTGGYPLKDYTGEDVNLMPGDTIVVKAETFRNLMDSTIAGHWPGAWEVLK